MAFGDPNVVFDQFSPYRITVGKMTDQGRLVASVNVQFNADGFEPQNIEAMFMTLLNHIVTSPDLEVLEASRSASGYQSITPDAPAPAEQ